MAHPRKKRRTQAPGTTQNAKALGVNKAGAGDRTPKSMVIRMGASDVGPSVTQLVKDMRSVMEPHTASRLRERRANRLRDYTTMAGPLGVSHFMLFSRSDGGNTNLRIAVAPRGPTLSFRVEKYSLCKDIAKAQRHPKSPAGGVEHLTPPLLVMNNFVTPTSDSTTSNPSQNPIPKHLETLTTSIFQSLFPSINPQRTPLTSIRRVLLINRERSSPTLNLAAGTGTYTLSLRHYAITTKPIVSLSRGLKRLRAATQFATTRKLKPQPSATATGKKARSAALPDMSRLDDVADYVLDPSGAGYTSASESEVDTDAEVEVMELKTRRVLSRRDREKALENKAPAETKEGARSGVQKRAVRLAEIGPRMTLRLVKVEEGLCDGKVMWHEFVTKTKEEQREMEATWETRRSEKAERKRIQKENVERKKKSRGKAGTGADKEGEDEDEEDWIDGYDDDQDYGDDFLKETVHEKRVRQEGIDEEESENEDEDEDEDEMEEE